MRKCISLFLLFVMVLPLFCISVNAYVPERTITGYQKEQIMYDTKDFTWPSSTAVSRWNSNYVSSGAQKITVVTDPFDSTNKVGLYGYNAPNKKGVLKKEKGISNNLQNEILWDFLIPSGDDDLCLPSTEYTFVLYNKKVIELVYDNTSNSYLIYFCGSEVGSMQKNSWVTFKLEYTPTILGETITGKVNVTVTGSLKDTLGTSQITLSSLNNTFTPNTSVFYINNTIASDASTSKWYGYYLDDVTMSVWNPIYETQPIPKEPIEVYDSSFVMPDKNNTGPRTTVVDVATKYPELVQSNYTIGETLAEQYNYEFSGFEATCETLTINCSHDVTIKDSIVHATSHYGIHNTGSGTLYVDHCIGTGTTSAFFSCGNLVVSYTEVYDCVGDLCKANSDNIAFLHCYFHDAGTYDPEGHADGVQFSGSELEIINNIKIIGCRIDMPALAQEHVSNACIFYDVPSTTKGYSNVQIIGNWFNGGGYSVYLMPHNLQNNTNITFTNNKFGSGNSFADIRVTDWTLISGTNNYNLNVSGGSYENNTSINKIDVGSVSFYDGESRIYDISSATSGSLKINLNMANYNLDNHSYKISYVLLNSGNHIVKEATTTGSIEAYTSPKVYNVESNMKTETIGGKSVKVLINKPDLPNNVSVDLTLSDLPTDLSGCSLSIIVEDTTSRTKTIQVRSCVLDDEVSENTITSLPEGMKYTITFLDKDGEELSVQTIKEGKNATPPTPPTLFGFKFDSWSSTEYQNVTKNATIQAQYEVVPTYTVSFKGKNGTILSTEEVEEHTSATPPSPPNIVDYRFVEWSTDDWEDVTSDLVVNAIYELIPVYEVTFKNELGEVIKTIQIQEGKTITSFEPSIKVGFVFDKWSTSSGDYTFANNITSDMVITLQIKINEKLFNDAYDTLQKSSTLEEKQSALKSLLDVLSLWTDEEESALEQTKLGTVNTMLDAYLGEVQNAILDLNKTQSIVNSIAPITTAVAFITSLITLSYILKRRLFF